MSAYKISQWLIIGAVLPLSAVHHEQPVPFANDQSLKLSLKLNALSLENKKADFLPDDICSPTRWRRKFYKDPEQIKKFTPAEYKAFLQQCDLPEDIFPYKTTVIRRRDDYCPEVIESDIPIIWVVIHGTFGSDTHDFFNDHDLENQNYRNIKRAAAWYATTQKKKLELHSYMWSGAYSSEDRLVAGQQLVNYFNYRKFFENRAEIVLLGHSHGGNISNYVTHLVPSDCPIQLLLYFGCPRRQEEYNQPLHYENLIYFFSDSDTTTVVGRANETTVKHLLTSGAWSLAKTMGMSFVERLANNLANYFASRKIFSDGAEGILQDAVAVTAGAADGIKSLDNGIAAIDQIKQIGTNEFPVENDRITVGFRTKIGGRNPWHSAIFNSYNAWPGHPPLLNVTIYLPEIIEKLQKNYLKHYSQSSTFHLNVDQKCKHANSEFLDPVILALRTQGTAISPAEFSYFAAGNIIRADEIPSEAGTWETKISEGEFNRFKNEYRYPFDQ